MKRLFIVAGMLFALLASRADAEMREFKLPNGKSVQAEIVSFDSRLGKVKLKLADGRPKTVKPGIFVKEDREYIKEWVSLDGFRNKTFFKVSCSKDMVEKWKEDIVSTVYIGGDRSNTEKMTMGEMKYEKFAYKLLLENRNAVPLENIKIEYCIFCKQKGKGQWRDRPDWFEKEKTGSLTIAKLPAKSKKTVATDPVVIARQEISGNIVSSGSGASYEKIGVELEGVWVRITIKTPGGLTATRSVFNPKNMEGKYAWPKKRKK